MGIEMVALRCAGFNNVDLDAAKELGIRVARVPAYSPEAVAEHTIAMMLTLNRKLHKAFNRVRDFGMEQIAHSVVRHGVRPHLAAEIAFDVGAQNV